MGINVKLKHVTGPDVSDRTRGKLIVIEGTDGSGKSIQTRILDEKLRKRGYRVQMTDFPQYGNSFFADMIEKYLKGEFGWPQELRDHLKTYPPSSKGIQQPEELAHDGSFKSSHKIQPGRFTPKADEVNPYLCSLLYAGDRWLLKDQMTQWLDQGVIITSNRYVCSNMAHQGAKIKDSRERNCFFKWLEELEYKVFGIPKPDLIIYLSVPIEISQRLIMERLQRSGDTKTELDMHEKDLGYLHAVQLIYEKLAGADNSWFTVKCAKNNQILPKEEISGKVWDIINKILP